MRARDPEKHWVREGLKAAAFGLVIGLLALFLMIELLGIVWGYNPGAFR